MDKRELSRKLRRSNVGDLIDDGIENGSDLKASARIEESEQKAPEVSNIDLPTQSKRRPALPGKDRRPAAPERDPMSYLGLFLGACFLLPGVALFLFPREVSVYHDRLKHGPSVVEHVTTLVAQAYALIAIVAGIAACGFSLYRPRR